MRLEKAASIVSLARRLAGSSEGLTIAEISAEFLVDRRTAERMRDAVRDLFPQMDEVRDGRTKRFLIRGGLDAFLDVPTVEELADLQLAAEAADQDGMSARAESLRTLARKVEARMKPGLRVRYAADIEALALAERIALSPGPRPACDPAVLRLLRAALLAMKQVRFSYRAGGEGPAVARTLDPCGLLFGSIYYLVGRVVGTPEAVLWRLDRMADLEVLDTASETPADFDLAVFAGRSFGVYQEPVEDIVLRVIPAAAERAASHRFHPGQTFAPQADGSLHVHLRAGGLLELCWHLFTWRGDIQVLEPPKLAAMMADELARFRRNDQS